MSSKKRLGLIIAGVVILIAVLGLCSYVLWNQASDVKQSVQPSTTSVNQIPKNDVAAERGKAYLETRDTYLEKAKNGDRNALDEYLALSKSAGDTAWEDTTSSIYIFSPSYKYWMYASSTKIIFWKAGTAHIFDVPDAEVFWLGVTPSDELVYEKVFMRTHADEPDLLFGLHEGIVYRMNADGVVHKLFAVDWHSEKLTFFGQKMGEADVVFPWQKDELGHDLITIDGNHMRTVETFSDVTYGYDLLTYARSGVWNTFEFYTRTDHFGSMFSKLQLRPEIKLDEATALSANCDTHFADYISDLSKSSKSALASFEGCIAISYYPFKKFPIPGSASYYAFMGNNDPSMTSGTGNAWCQMDGMENGCILYKVQNGNPTVLASGNDLRQKEPLKARADGSILIHVFPYEIVYFQKYEWYDFVNNTSTGGVIDYEGGGDWDGSYVSSTLTFYPNGKPIIFVVGGGPREGDSYTTTTLSFNGTYIGSIDIKAVDAFEQGAIFPDESDMKAYALQSDKTKFYIRTVSNTYTLDLAPAIPKLIKH